LGKPAFRAEAKGRSKQMVDGTNHFAFGTPARSTSAATKPSFDGAYGRMFSGAKPADFGGSAEAALKKLAAAMTLPAPVANEGPSPQESGIPAAYTYFGQLVAHDLTFDMASSHQPETDLTKLVDQRTPRFDLDGVYGRGPLEQPYFFDGKSFLLGDPPDGGSWAFDVPRQKQTQRALIGDPRNDAHVIISQLHALFLRFHNRIAKDRPTWSFEEIQREVQFHYQWVVLNDFLPRIVHQPVLDSVLRKGADGKLAPEFRSFHYVGEPFMPVEFSAAACRFGHSMVRANYRLNRPLGPFAILGQDPLLALMGFKKPPGSWGIDWTLFIDLPGAKQSWHGPDRVQLAHKIDTTLVNPLADLPPALARDGAPNLAFRTLRRGWELGLPSGQEVARRMNLTPLDDEQILIGNTSEDLATPIRSVDPGFSNNCPLWTYVLAETVEVERPVSTTEGEQRVKTRLLGEVGGRIVAETFLGLLMGDRSSLLYDPQWKPSFTGAEGVFGLRELIFTSLAE
jgi:Animal haem peroxidase